MKKGLGGGAVLLARSKRGGNVGSGFGF